MQVAGLLPPLGGLAPEGEPVLLPNNAYKQGRTLPLKLQLFCGAQALTGTDVSPPQIAALVRAGAAINLAVIDPDPGEANDSGVLFRFSGGNWVYNLSTTDLITGSYVITIQMPEPDGRLFNAGFVLK